MARSAPPCATAAGEAAMPKSNMHKVSVDDPDGKPSLFATAFVFLTITLATVLASVLIAYGARALFNWIVG
jgi:hypothetical protein